MALGNTSPAVASSAGALDKRDNSLAGLLNNVNVRKKFDDMLGKKAPGFLSSLLSLYNNSSMLQKCEPMTIIAQAAIAASLDLPINPSLGFAAIVPYNDPQSGRTLPQFQMMYKGFIQLGMRTGQYKNISASEVYEDEFESWNEITGELRLTDQKTWKMRDSGKGKIVGYVAFFRLMNGFEKYFYMSVEKVMQHGKKFSKSFQKGKGRWATDFHVMAMKTPLKLLLSKYGPLSIDNQTATAIKADQATADPNDPNKMTYHDNPTDVIDVNESDEADEDLPKEKSPAPPAEMAGDAQEPEDLPFDKDKKKK